MQDEEVKNRLSSLTVRPRHDRPGKDGTPYLEEETPTASVVLRSLRFRV
jgi:hypothetical protein